MDPLNYYTDETQVFERKSIDSDYFKNEKSITYKNLKNTLNTRYKFLAAGINNDSKDTNINPFKFSRPEIEEKSPTSSPKGHNNKKHKKVNVVIQTTVTTLDRPSSGHTIFKNRKIVNRHNNIDNKKNRQTSSFPLLEIVDNNPSMTPLDYVMKTIDLSL